MPYYGRYAFHYYRGGVHSALRHPGCTESRHVWRDSYGGPQTSSHGLAPQDVPTCTYADHHHVSVIGGADRDYG